MVLVVCVCVCGGGGGGPSPYWQELIVTLKTLVLCQCLPEGQSSADLIRLITL